MTFRKGQSGNLHGRPLGSKNLFNLKEFAKALKAVENEKKISVLKYFIERALQNDTVLIALMKKMLPDKVESLGDPKDKPLVPPHIVFFTDKDKIEKEKVNRNPGVYFDTLGDANVEGIVKT